MPRHGYTIVNLPTAMTEAIENLIKDKPELGYRSKDEVVRDFVRDGLNKQGYKLKEVVSDGNNGSSESEQ